MLPGARFVTMQLTTKDIDKSVVRGAILFFRDEQWNPNRIRRLVVGEVHVIGFDVQVREVGVVFIRVFNDGTNNKAINYREAGFVEDAGAASLEKPDRADHKN